MANREGKLTPSQWGEIVTQPLVSLMVLMLPLAFIIPRLLLGFGMVMMVLAAVMLAVIVFRAYRYARLPIYCEEFEARDGILAVWKIWRPTVLYNEKGDAVRFDSRLMPSPRLVQGQPYLVYYLRDNDKRVLLSLVPSDHADIERWQPTPAFRARLQKRS